MKLLLLRYKATLSYILLIILINSLFSFVPLISLWGQRVSPADVMVGCVYIFRDFSQREIRSYVLVAMLIGGLLSYIFATSSVAAASLCAFVIGEFIDWVLFTWTKKPLAQRLLLSSVCSCPVDSAVFLYLIARFNWLEFILITLFKILGVLWVWFYWRSQKTPLSPMPNQVVLP